MIIILQKIYVLCVKMGVKMGIIPVKLYLQARKDVKNSTKDEKIHVYARVRLLSPSLPLPSLSRSLFLSLRGE